MRCLVPTRDFDILFHPVFQDALSKLRDPIKLTAIEKKLKKFMENPEHFSTPYKGDLAGNRKVKVMADLRIVVTLCWECRTTNHQGHHECPCDQIPENTVICWYVGDHKDIDRRAYRVVTSVWEIE